MNKKLVCLIVILALIGAIALGLYHKTTIIKNDTPVENNEPAQEQTTAINTESKIVEIPLDAVKGITPEEAEELCYFVLGEKDQDTGFTFSFGTAGAVEKDKKSYYVIRASWLVNNSHMSYIGDFFVSADGKEIYNGTALPGEYTMQNIIWSE